LIFKELQACFIELLNKEMMFMILFLMRFRENSNGTKCLMDCF